MKPRYFIVTLPYVLKRALDLIGMVLPFIGSKILGTLKFPVNVDFKVQPCLGFTTLEEYKATFCLTVN